MTLAPLKFYLSRHYVNSQGYDSSGSYWGTGMPLYYHGAFVPGDGMQHEGHLRASNRDKAKAELQRRFPGCTFYQIGGYYALEPRTIPQRAQH